MPDQTSIQINVDTFSDGEGYFVRTEIDTHSVSISGPFADLASAQKLKSEQLANREPVSQRLKEALRDAALQLPKGRSG